jgi:hypothetical protein
MRLLDFDFDSDFDMHVTEEAVVGGTWPVQRQP